MKQYGWHYGMGQVMMVHSFVGGHTKDNPSGSAKLC